MPVTRSWLTVERSFAVDVAAPGWPSRTLSVRPAGMLEGMLAEILAPVWLVVTDQTELASDTGEGSLPAVAVVMVRVTAVEVMLNWLIGLTSKFTVWVWAPAAEARPATRLSTAAVRPANLAIIVIAP